MLSPVHVFTRSHHSAGAQPRLKPAHLPSDSTWNQQLLTTSSHARISHRLHLQRRHASGVTTSCGQSSSSRNLSVSFSRVLAA